MNVLSPLPTNLVRPLWKVVCLKNTLSTAQCWSTECTNIKKSSDQTVQNKRLVRGREAYLYRGILLYQALASNKIRLLALKNNLTHKTDQLCFTISRKPPSCLDKLISNHRLTLPFSAKYKTCLLVFNIPAFQKTLMAASVRRSPLWLLGHCTKTKLPPVLNFSMPSLPYGFYFFPLSTIVFA